ncbi:MAG: DEAD/DEAH box helicase, partial [Actinomycetota bacterium]|nr:DEAD/DEAH box helicase [Actinomycetota bacterium]
LEFDQRKGIISLKWNPPESEFNSHNVTTVTFVDYVPPTPKPQALFSFVEDWLQNPESKSVTNALLRGDKPSYSIDLEEDASLEDKVSHLDNSYIVIQGPPGTGKTYTGAHLIHHLIKVEGKRVGITAQSWNAIDLLLEKTVGVFKDKDFDSLNAVRKIGKDGKPKEIDGVDYKDGKPDSFAGYNLIASTTWFWANKDFNEDNKVDYLVIDEAGQLALVDALVASRGAKNLVLIGDPQQLPQVTQANHLCGAGASVLEHVMGDSNVVSEDQGVLLNETHRLRPEICDFISEEFYDAKLESHEKCKKRIVHKGNGLFWAPVVHEGDCVNESEEEATAVLEIIQDLLGTDWTDENGKSKQLEPQDFMVVAPYNAQVNKIKQMLLEAEDLQNITKDNVMEIVGTVDRFQGKEAPVVVYSLTTSRQDLIPRGRKGDFLFSPNRLNVAVSRAQCLAYMVGTEELIDTHASSISEMKALNHFCRYVDDLAIEKEHS